MANINLIEHKKRLGEEVTPSDYERQIERLEFINNFLRLENEKLRTKAQKNKIINWFKNLIK